VRLITAHRILILCGIAFFVVYAVIKTQKYLTRGDNLDLVQAVVALLIACGFQWYFRSLARRWR
jgi:ABC-type transport system involved in cytochrome bd biosynthesis fused ATPase/permease subunit